MSIYKELNIYIDEKVYPFHMPGHKRNPKYLSFEKPLINYDITELGNMDNLHDPDGLIREMNERCANIFGSQKSFLMVNGSSGGIIASIMSICKDGDSLLVARNCHKSVFNGLIYSGAYPKYIYPSITDMGLVGGINPSDIRNELEKDKNIKGVLITSPTYEGFTSDIETIAQIVHSYNKILIVDEAHGAHFNFSSNFPKTSLEQGADIVIQSLHKTLPSFTQTAVLHVQNNLVNRELLANNISMIQTTSPSYMLMTSIDICLNFLEKNSVYEFDAYTSRLKNFRKLLSECKNIRLIDDELKNKHNIKDIDISKLVFYINKKVSGKNIDKNLYSEHKIQLELSSDTHILALTSVADTEYGFKCLSDAIYCLNEKISGIEDREITAYNYPKSKAALSPRQAITQDTKKVKLADSNNMVSAQFITPYPPGIPLIIPGELITCEIIQSLQKFKIYNDISVIA